MLSWTGMARPPTSYATYPTASLPNDMRNMAHIGAIAIEKN